MPASIVILNGASLHPREVDRILRNVGAIFELPVVVRENTLDIQRAYDTSRRQYNSTVLLAHILASTRPANSKQIAVVDVDLYIPILTFVFGEAQLDGTAAIVSTHRLSNQFYGMEEDNVLRLDRLEKEIVHELGHTFGLLHCRQFECVMRTSTYVEEIDLKHREPCTACGAILKEKVRAVKSVEHRA